MKVICDKSEPCQALKFIPLFCSSVFLCFWHLPQLGFYTLQDIENIFVYLNLNILDSVWSTSLFQKYLLSPQKPFCSFIVSVVTQFVWPYLLSQFWHVFCHSGPLHSPTSGCPCLPTEQTLTVSHFFLSKRLGAFLQDWCLQSVSPLLPNVPVYMFHFGLPSDGKRWRGERVCDKNWSCLVILTDNWWRRMFWCPSPESWTQKGLNDENYIIQKQTNRNFSLVP